MLFYYSFSFVFLLAILFPAILVAQPEQKEDKEPDTVRIYRLGEVTVTGTRATKVSPATVSRVSMGKVRQTDAPTVADVVYQIPAARIQTNSRGESLIYLRNAGERQVAVFLDGALINVPWDNRIDLSLVPLTATGEITVEKGVPSVQYGANVLGGAINIVSREMADEGVLTEVEGFGTVNGTFNGSLMHMGRSGVFNYITAARFLTRDAIPLPADADLPFNQLGDDVRTNTDQRIASLYLRGEYQLSDNATLGLSLNGINGEKGIAAEGHKDPEESTVRFWRYPEWQNLNVTLNGEMKFGAYSLWNLRGALWGVSFTQQIDQYESNLYQQVQAAQKDDDITFGARIILSKEFDSSSVALSVNALQSTHDQTDLEFDDAVGTIIPTLEQEYQQQLYSVGLEYRGTFEHGITALIGASLDGMATPTTGNKPKQDPFSDYSFTFGLSYPASEAITFRGSMGRKTRFPTMRELYGEALNRFLINPDLKPEQAWMGELGAEGQYEWGSFSLVPFARFTTETIDQRNLTDATGARKRQRINLPGSRAIGIEATGAVYTFRPFKVDAHITYTYVRGFANDVSGNDSTFFLAEKPELLGVLSAQYDFPFGLFAVAEAIYTGLAYSPDDNNVFVELDPSVTFNLRLAYRTSLPFTNHSFGELFVRMNNITDAVTLPQLGLPGAGREIEGGIKFSF